MKESVLDLIKNLSRNCRETATLRFEQRDIDAESFCIIAHRLDSLYNLIDQYFKDREDDIKLVVFWKFLFDNPSIYHEVRGPEVLIFHKDAGPPVKVKLLGKGLTFREAVQNALLMYN